MHSVHIQNVIKNFSLSLATPIENKQINFNSSPIILTIKRQSDIMELHIFVVVVPG